MNKPKGISKNVCEKHFESCLSQNDFQKAGVHILADFWFGRIIEDKEEIRKILIEASKCSGSTLLKTGIHKFYPQGITGFALLAESHIALHSWPEMYYLSIDIFTCGGNVDPYKAFQYLKEKFQPQKIELKEVVRGNVENLKQ